MNSLFCQYIEYQDAHANLLTEITVTINSLCNFTIFWKELLICSPCVLLVLCLFVILVDFQFRFEGNTLVLITPVPDRCYFFSYIQTLFAILLVYIFNNFSISSFMLRIFWSFHDVFSKLVP